MVSIAEMLFYAESEGLLPTRLGRINSVILDIKDAAKYNLADSNLEFILRENGFYSLDELTDKEIDYINRNLRDVGVQIF